MDQTTALAYKLKEMSGRIKELREIQGISQEEMARLTGVGLDAYLECEAGESDLNFAFLYRTAQVLNVDVTDIIEGASPTLSSYIVTRSGEGQRIEEAHGMVYYNLAPSFKNRIAQPLQVRAIYHPGAEYSDIELTSHAGQECDIVISGQLKVQVGEHTETLSAGDSIYYDSGTPHGMAAVGGQDCMFYAIVLNPYGEPVPEPADLKSQEKEGLIRLEQAPDQEKGIWQDFIITDENEKGGLRAITFKNENYFNFAFDVVDELARTKPDKLALVHVDRYKEARRFTFEDISRGSNRVANYFKSLGIKKGDRVMTALRRNHQFWFIIMGLHKLGAIIIPATDQLLQKDFEYRFQAAGVSAIICTSDSESWREAELAMENYSGIQARIMVNGAEPGWHDFDEEYLMFRSSFERTEESACGKDLMLMFFTSGTTGYPKIAAHNYKYPLGHFITAHYWQCVDPNGLHLTISDTGWAKAMWGKLYGQWLSEAAVFVYDFDRFEAHDILPMFAQYGITTFCAPPTMYRFLIKEDLSKYDLSSIKHATTAGEALNPEVFHQFKKATGLSVMEGFGQSETTVMIGSLKGMTPRIGSMGKPISALYQVELLDKDGNPAKQGETGEICIRTAEGSPCGLFTGYYGDQAQTQAAWHDGYYHTGDTAWRDEDGYFWYVGRTDDLIKSSGYRIGPFEIESVIMELPYVLECAVCGSPDETRGQVVKACIVLTKGVEASDQLKQEIQDYVKHRTAPYKYPRIVEFRESLPKTISGKIIRRQL